MEISEFEDDDLERDDSGLRRTDPDALRVLAHWVMDHAGRDRNTGVIVDRDFFVVDVPTMSSHRVR